MTINGNQRTNNYIKLPSIDSFKNDLTALTPGHFLLGAQLASIPEPELFAVSNNRLKHWQQL